MISAAYHAVLTLNCCCIFHRRIFLPVLFAVFVFDVNQLNVKFVDHYAITQTDCEKKKHCIIISKDSALFWQNNYNVYFLHNIFRFERHCFFLHFISCKTIKTDSKITWLGYIAKQRRGTF